MNKTKIIKNIIGSVLAEKGFKYIRCEKKIIWTFGRKVENVEQEVYIQQHTLFDEEYKLMFWTSAKGNGMKEIGNILSEYEKKEYWQAETDDKFVELMKFFAEFICEYGVALLEEMLTEKSDSFETTERKLFFKEHRKELAEKYDKKYNILSIESKDEQLKKIDEVLWDNRTAEENTAEFDRIYDLLLGMAAILTEIALKKEKVEIDYDAWRIEVKVDGYSFWPIFTVVQAWLRYHQGNKDMLVVWAMARTFI